MKLVPEKSGAAFSRKVRATKGVPAYPLTTINCPWELSVCFNLAIMLLLYHGFLFLCCFFALLADIFIFQTASLSDVGAYTIIFIMYTIIINIYFESL